MTLRRKLMIAFAIVLALVGLQTGVTLLLLTRTVEGTAQLVRPALTRVDALAHIDSDLQRLRTLEYTYLISASPSIRKQTAGEMDALRASIQRFVELYAGLDLDEVRVSAFSKIAEGYRAYLASQEQVIWAIERGDSSEALWEYLRFQYSYQDLDDRIHTLRHEEYRATEALRDRLVYSATLARWPVGIIMVLVAVFEAGLGWYLSHSITWSLDVLQQGAHRIAKENFEEPVPPPPERELAALADSLNHVMVALATSKSETARLQEERLQLLRERLSQIVQAQEEERARVSRELHDQAGQALTALHYGLSRVQRLADDPAVAAEIERLVTLASDAGRQISALARDLRPAVLDDLGLIPALRSYIRGFSERVGIPIEFSIPSIIQRLSPEAETTVFRVVQEALTNVAKHAQAKHAWVDLTIQDAGLRVRVRDNGRGFDPTGFNLGGPAHHGLRAGLGLAGIRERVQLLGGSFTIGSQEGKGTEVLVTFPIETNLPAAPAAVKEVAGV